MTYAVRYALGKSTLAPSTMKRIIGESLEGLYKQTKQGIIQDIEDYIDQNELVPDLSIWKEIEQMLQEDLERKRKPIL